MSTLSNETLHKVCSIFFIFYPTSDYYHQILNQIQQTAVNSQRQLAISKNMTAAKERERKILQLTTDELNGLNKDVNLYKGVGKMCELSCVLTWLG